MPSGQILYLMMFVGNLACTSHVLQYSSSRSYEHSRSLQSSLCPGAVTVLICSFFVAALLLIYRNLENSGKIIHIFTNRQTFSYLFCIFSQFHPRKNWIFRIILVFLHPKALEIRQRLSTFANIMLCPIFFKDKLLSITRNAPIHQKIIK